MLVAVLVSTGTVSANFGKRSVINNYALLPLLASISRPRVSMLTYTHGQVPGNGLRFVTCLQGLIRLQAQDAWFFTTLYESILVLIQ